MDRFQVGIDWLRAMLSRMMASFKALLSSPSVWMAVGVIFAIGFSAGHWERSRVLKKVRSERDAAVLSVSSAEKIARESNRTRVEAERETAELKEKLAKLEKHLGRRRLK